MSTIFIKPADEIQAINDAIYATRLRATVIFEPGTYVLDRKMRFVKGRSYIGHGAILQCMPELESMITVIERPDAEKSRIESFLSTPAIAWICRLFHIPIENTLITGFEFYGNGQCACIHFS